MEKESSIVETTDCRSTQVSRKRKLSLAGISSDQSESRTTVLDNSCPSSVASLKPIHQIPLRPNTLLLSSTTSQRSFSSLRSCQSHPSTSPVLLDTPRLSLLKFSSVPDLFSPPTKRARPETLCLSKTPSPTSISSNLCPPPTFITASELVEKLQDNHSLTIFDCGSPIRHSEKRIRGATLFHVADKISRKRLKTSRLRDSIVVNKLLNECRLVILYDDENRSNCLSSGLKCAWEEIHRLQIDTCPLIRILNCSFEQFVNVYPHLCESPQTRSCPSSPVAHHQLSSSPRTAPTYSFLSLQSEKISTTPDIENHPMTHIIDGLFIGGESNAKNLEELASEQIQRIVNVTSHVPLYHTEQFQYCHIPADDTQKQNLIDYFDQAFNFINHAIKNNEKVLVHCVAGISRSPAIVIAFLMQYAKMTMNDAYEFVKRKRSIVSPNLNFMGQLLEYEKILKQRKTDDCV